MNVVIGKSCQFNLYGSVKCCVLAPRHQLPFMKLVFMYYRILMERIAYDRNRVVALKYGKAADLS